MKHESDKGEFVFAIMLCILGFIPVSGLLSGLVYDDSIWNSSFWLVVNFILLAIALWVEWILLKYTRRVYRREFNGIRDIIRTIRSIWSEIKKEVNNA
jgi:formate hydrogenlyase subunit 3/multisubunit Na+/H+ antiporter MnhD subunit